MTSLQRPLPVIKLLLASLICVVQAEAYLEPNALKSFIMVSLQSFPSWARSNGLDPLLYPAPVDISVNLWWYLLTAEVRNQVVSGLSNISQLHVSTSNFSQGAGASNASFSIQFNFNYKVVGEYKLDGKILEAFPAKGAGPFVSEDKYGPFMRQVTFSNFKVTDKGHLDLTESEVEVSPPKFRYHKMKFFGIEVTPGKENIVQKLLENRHRDEAWRWTSEPLKDSLRKYLEEVFKEYSV